VTTCEHDPAKLEVLKGLVEACGMVFEEVLEGGEWKVSFKGRPQALEAAHRGLVQLFQWKYGEDSEAPAYAKEADVGKSVRQVMNTTLGVPLSARDVKIGYPLPSAEQAKRTRKLMAEYAGGGEEDEGFAFDKPAVAQKRKDARSFDLTMNPAAVKKRRLTVAAVRFVPVSPRTRRLAREEEERNKQARQHTVVADPVKSYDPDLEF